MLCEFLECENVRNLVMVFGMVKSFSKMVFGMVKGFLKIYRKPLIRIIILYNKKN